jgi:hypothetical protein
MFSLGCIVGSLPSGFLTDFMGRKRCIIFLSFVFTVGAVIQLVPSGYQMLLAGRFISGVGRFGRRPGRAPGGLRGGCFPLPARLLLVMCGRGGSLLGLWTFSEIAKRRSNSLGAPPLHFDFVPPTNPFCLPICSFSFQVWADYPWPPLSTSQRPRRPRWPTSHSTFPSPFPPSLPPSLPSCFALSHLLCF